MENGYIIRTGDGKDLKEQMRMQMREQYRNNGNHGAMKTVGHEFETGYRQGFRDGYEEGMRDAYGTNASENRNLL